MDQAVEAIHQIGSRMFTMAISQGRIPSDIHKAERRNHLLLKHWRWPWPANRMGSTRIILRWISHLTLPCARFESSVAHDLSAGEHMSHRGGEIILAWSHGICAMDVNATMCREAKRNSARH
jgi:hypothetical protein